MKKKNYVTKCFWTNGNTFTQNAFLAYLYVVQNLEKGAKITDELLNQAQRSVGVPEGKNSLTILWWGINPSCHKSRTSSKRAIVMTSAFNSVKSAYAMGLRLSMVTP